MNPQFGRALRTTQPAEANLLCPTIENGRDSTRRTPLIGLIGKSVKGRVKAFPARRRADFGQLAVGHAHDIAEIVRQEAAAIAEETSDRARDPAGEASDQPETQIEASGTARRAREKAANATDALAGVPHAARRSAESRPLAAGLLSFATGFLLASVVPPTDAEGQMTERLKESLRPVEEEAKQRRRLVADRLARSARHDVEEVKEAATGAAQRVKSELQDHAGELRYDARSAAEDVKDEAADAAHSVQRKAKGAVRETASASRGPQATATIFFRDGNFALADRLSGQI